MQAVSTLSIQPEAISTEFILLSVISTRKLPSKRSTSPWLGWGIRVVGVWGLYAVYGVGLGPPSR